MATKAVLSYSLYVEYDDNGRSVISNRDTLNLKNTPLHEITHHHHVEVEPAKKKRKKNEKEDSPEIWTAIVLKASENVRLLTDQMTTDTKHGCNDGEMRDILTTKRQRLSAEQNSQEEEESKDYEENRKTLKNDLNREKREIKKKVKERQALKKMDLVTQMTCTQQPEESEESSLNIGAYIKEMDCNINRQSESYTSDCVAAAKAGLELDFERKKTAILKQNNDIVRKLKDELSSLKSENHEFQVELQRAKSENENLKKKTVIFSPSGCIVCTPDRLASLGKLKYDLAKASALVHKILNDTPDPFEYVAVDDFEEPAGDIFIVNKVTESNIENRQDMENDYGQEISSASSGSSDFIQTSTPKTTRISRVGLNVPEFQETGISKIASASHGVGLNLAAGSSQAGSVVGIGQETGPIAVGPIVGFGRKAGTSRGIALNLAAGSNSIVSIDQEAAVGPAFGLGQVAGTSQGVGLDLAAGSSQAGSVVGIGQEAGPIVVKPAVGLSPKAVPDEATSRIPMTKELFIERVEFFSEPQNQLKYPLFAHADYLIPFGDPKHGVRINGASYNLLLSTFGQKKTSSPALKVKRYLLNLVVSDALPFLSFEGKKRGNNKNKFAPVLQCVKDAIMGLVCPGETVDSMGPDNYKSYKALIGKELTDQRKRLDWTDTSRPAPSIDEEEGLNILT